MRITNPKTWIFAEKTQTMHFCNRKFVEKLTSNILASNLIPSKKKWVAFNDPWKNAGIVMEMLKMVDMIN